MSDDDEEVVYIGSQIQKGETTETSIEYIPHHNTLTETDQYFSSKP